MLNSKLSEICFLCFRQETAGFEIAAYRQIKLRSPHISFMTIWIDAHLSPAIEY